MEQEEDDYNTDDPTGRYIHEPKWVEYLRENHRPHFTTEDGKQWYTVGILGGWWADTLDEGTTHVGMTYERDKGPLGHFYGFISIGDPREGGEVLCCTQLEQGTLIGVACRACSSVNDLVELRTTHPDGKTEILCRSCLPVCGVCGRAVATISGSARWGPGAYVCDGCDDQATIDFGLVASGNEVSCAICEQRFIDGERVFRVHDGVWNDDGPNFEDERDDRTSTAFVHARCLKHTTY